MAAVAPFSEVRKDLNLHIPLTAPPGGPYTLFLDCGPYPDIFHESFFEFTITD